MLQTLIQALEAPDDPRLEETVQQVLAKDIDEPSANFMLESLLSAQQRWDELVNTKGNTFRQLPPAKQQGLDAARAAELMVQAPSVIKRPVIETEKELLLGFDPERYQAVLGKRTRSR